MFINVTQLCEGVWHDVAWCFTYIHMVVAAYGTAGEGQCSMSYTLLQQPSSSPALHYCLSFQVTSTIRYRYFQARLYDPFHSQHTRKTDIHHVSHMYRFLFLKLH